MKVKWFLFLKIVDVKLAFLLDFLLGFPKVLVTGQVAMVDGHLDDFTLRCKLFEHFLVYVQSIVHITKVFLLKFLLPLSE